MHRFSSFWTFWKPFDPIQNLRGVTFWIFNFWQNVDTLMQVRYSVWSEKGFVKSPFFKRLKIFMKKSWKRNWIGRGVPGLTTWFLERGWSNDNICPQRWGRGNFFSKIWARGIWMTPKKFKMCNNLVTLITVVVVALLTTSAN